MHLSVMYLNIIQKFTANIITNLTIKNNNARPSAKQSQLDLDASLHQPNTYRRAIMCLGSGSMIGVDTVVIFTRLASLSLS